MEQQKEYLTLCNGDICDEICLHTILSRPRLDLLRRVKGLPPHSEMDLFALERHISKWNNSHKKTKGKTTSFSDKVLKIQILVL